MCAVVITWKNQSSFNLLERLNWGCSLISFIVEFTWKYVPRKYNALSTHHNQDGRCSAHGILKYIFSIRTFAFWFESYVQVMTWHLTGGKPLAELMKTSSQTHYCVTGASMVWLHRCILDFNLFPNRMSVNLWQKTKAPMLAIIQAYKSVSNQWSYFHIFGDALQRQ